MTWRIITRVESQRVFLDNGACWMSSVTCGSFCGSVESFPRYRLEWGWYFPQIVSLERGRGSTRGVHSAVGVFRFLRWTCLRVCSHPRREQLCYVYNDYKHKLQITIMVPTTSFFWSLVPTPPRRRVNISLLLLTCTDSSCSYAGGTSNSFNPEANPFHMPLLVRVPQVRLSSNTSAVDVLLLRP
jgi:hypothetical protein